jgi:hypothetical protein
VFTNHIHSERERRGISPQPSDGKPSQRQTGAQDHDWRAGCLGRKLADSSALGGSLCVSCAKKFVRATGRNPSGISGWMPGGERRIPSLVRAEERLQLGLVQNPRILRDDIHGEALSPTT